MKIIEPSATLVGTINPTDILKKLELCGRVSHKSDPKDDSAVAFVRNIIKLGHESVLEHVTLTFKIVCDRGVSHELVRHRFLSPTQESTRFIKYNEIEYLLPPLVKNSSVRILNEFVETAERAYRELIQNGEKSEVARAVLPNCLKTELFVTANLREWRHILKLRTDKAAHPQMRQIAFQILDTFKKFLPVIVEDIDRQ